MVRGRSATAVAGPVVSLSLQRVHSFLRIALRFSKRKPLGAAGGLVLIAMVLVAVVAPYITSLKPSEVHTRFLYQPPGTECDVESACRQDFGKTFILGTDFLGRDTYSRLIYGTRTSLYVALISVGIGITLGLLIGVISAYFGGLFDLLVQRAVDTLMAFPALILALAIVAIFGASTKNVILALVVILVPGSARVIRSQAMAIKEMDYMLAGRALGASAGRRIFRHMLPNCMAPAIVFGTANLGLAIIVEASLSFLGLGTPPSVASWGGMLAHSGQKYIAVAPWNVLFPSVAISIAVFGFNLFGDALRDVLDPRLRGTQG